MTHTRHAAPVQYTTYQLSQSRLFLEREDPDPETDAHAHTPSLVPKSSPVGSYTLPERGGHLGRAPAHDCRPLAAPPHTVTHNLSRASPNRITARSDGLASDTLPHSSRPYLHSDARHNISQSHTTFHDDLVRSTCGGRAARSHNVTGRWSPRRHRPRHTCMMSLACL